MNETKQILTGIILLMGNHFQIFINKEIFLYSFLHFIDKKWLEIQNNKGNYDLWKTNISDKGVDRIGKRFNNKK